MYFLSVILVNQLSIKLKLNYNWPFCPNCNRKIEQKGIKEQFG